VRGAGERAFRVHSGLTVAAAAVGLLAAGLASRTAEERLAAVVAVGLAALTGAVALVLQRRTVRQGMQAALKVVGIVFGLRAICVVVGLLWVVSQGLDAVAFVAGFFGTYFVLQWIDVSYVMAASKDAAGGDE
jgi:hypothetical protein